MEEHVRSPDPLIKGDDMAKNWQIWKEDFISFMNVTGYIKKSTEMRANLLKNQIGRVGIEAMQNISFDQIEDKDDMDILIKKLDEYFNPPKNEVMERYFFFTTVKKQNISIEQYINILKEKAKTCNFEHTMIDNIIRDKIVFETHDKILRQKFFEIGNNLNLTKLIAIYNDHNINTEKMKQFTKYCCWRCGIQHPVQRCPAWGSKCEKCGDLHHYTGRCRDLKSKINDNKINKNVLDQTQQIFTSKVQK